MIEMVEGDETLFLHLVFSDDVTFHFCGTLNRHNMHIWGKHHPHETVEHQRSSPKVNVFCVSGQSLWSLFL